MRCNLIYINFHASVYSSEGDFYKEQYKVLDFKALLAKNNQLHYFLNNNLNINETYKGVQIISKQKHKISFIIDVIQYIRKNKINVVVVHGLDYFIEAFMVKLFVNAKIILQNHAEKTYLRKKALLMPFIDKFIDAYFFNGKEIAVPYVQNGCIHSLNKIYSVVEASSDFQIDFPITERETKEIIFIGRLNENKNLITLLKAIHTLKEKRHDFHLSIYYTSSELEASLKSFCEVNHLNGIVSFKGSVSSHEMEAILNQSDIFVSCSLYEGSGYSLIEALSCGCFTITSNIPSFNFLLEGLDAKKQFFPNDDKELASKLDYVLDMNITKDIRNNIRAHFEKHCSSIAIVKQIEGAILSLGQK